jgi:hypothetical protein
LVALGSLAFGFLAKLFHLLRRALAVHPRHHGVRLEVLALVRVLLERVFAGRGLYLYVH